MKRIVVLMVLSVFMLSNTAFTSLKTGNETQGLNSELTKKIDVYYFHFTRRCITCNAVEKITKETIREYFSDKVKSGKISFKSVNLDMDGGKKIAKQLEVSGQTLLFISDSKKINLTNDAFMYAKNQPEKLKFKVKKTIDTLLE